MSHPPVSVWEHRAAVERLRERGRRQVDEDALFRMVEQMRSITETASATSRKTRRDAARRADNDTATSRSRIGGIAEQHVPPDDTAAAAPATPFDVIEQW